MPSFEKQEQPKTGFDYVAAADLARQKIEFENSSEKELGEDEYKKTKSKLKQQIKAYGNIDVNDPDKTPAERKIFELEVERQRLLIAQKNNEQPEVLNARQIEYDPDLKMFIFETKGGYKVRRTAGDLISDINLDSYYIIENAGSYPEMGEFIKIYQAKIFDAKLAELRDEQKIIEKTESKYKSSNTGVVDAYLAIYESIKNKKKAHAKNENYIDTHSGAVFERMIRCIVVKLAHDLGEKWGFDSRVATVEQDVRYSIDVILDLIKKRRGIGVEKNLTESELAKGFQVTLITTGSTLWDKKKKQVDRRREEIQSEEKPPVDELALINPGEEFEDVASTLKLWQRQGQVAGGPENFLSIEKAVDKYLKTIFNGTKLDFDTVPEFYEEIKKICRDRGMKEKD